LKVPFQAIQGITQSEAALFEAAQREFVRHAVGGTPVDQSVQIGMLDAQLNELALGGMEAGVQGRGRGMAKMPQAGG
jgi:hypothetical protein